MDKNEEDLIVGGYRFATLADAETARLEKKKAVVSLKSFKLLLNRGKLEITWSKLLTGRWFMKKLVASNSNRPIYAGGNEVRHIPI